VQLCGMVEEGVKFRPGGCGDGKREAVPVVVR
jgi:hypothetical protein